MDVVVDTSVWSLALRRPAKRLSDKQRNVVSALGDLIGQGRVLLIGLVRQELLSSISNAATYERLRDHLRAFPNVPLGIPDYEYAAEIGNASRSAGIATSAVDLLICAAAIRRECTLFTTDGDFQRYARVAPLKLFTAP